MPKANKRTPRPTKQDRAGALLLAMFLDSGDVPDYITDGAARVVYEAEEATGIEVVRMNVGDGGVDVAALARLIAVTRGGLPTEKGGAGK